MFGKYYETFGKMAAKVARPEDSATPDPMLVECLAAARKELPEDYKEVARGEALAATKPEEAKQVLEAVAKNPGTSARAQRSAANVLLNRLFKYAEAVTAYELALKLAVDEEGEQSEQAALVNLDLATARFYVNDLAGAEAAIAKTIAWGEAQSPRHEQSLAVCYGTRAAIRRHRGLLNDAADDIDKAIAWGEAQSSRDEHSLAIWYASRARIRRDQKQYPQALADIDRSLTWAKAQQPIDNLGIAIWSGDRATILAEMDRIPEALENIAHSIAWYRQHQPEAELHIAFILRDQARILAYAGDWTKAASAIGESLRCYRAVFGPDHEWTRKARAWRDAIGRREVPARWIDTAP
ncbi:MAG: hypothetical protein ACK5XO_03350 [Phycisphaerales bacterium]